LIYIEQSSALKGFEAITKMSYWVENALNRKKFFTGKVFKPLYLDELG
jgi:hypothetical protein